MSKPILRRSAPYLHATLLALAILAYVLIVLLFPATTSSAYHFSRLQIVIISITLMVPWIATWILGVMGYLRLERYAAAIKDGAPTRPFHLLARGIMILLWGLILATLISSLRSHYLSVHVVVVASTIAVNYIYALTPLVGFYYILQAIRQLGYGRLNLRRISPNRVLALAGFVAFMALYIGLTFTNANRQVDLSSAVPATYYLPDWLIVLTIVLPVALGWIFGILAVVNMYKYQRNIPGFIYRRFMKVLSRGIILIVLGSMLLQALQSLGTGRLLSVGLPSLLELLYLFLLIQLIGYLLVNLGSKWLTRIEKS